MFKIENLKGDDKSMEFSLDLEKTFPTEESRFDAYKKWIIISTVCSPIFYIAGRSLEFSTRQNIVPGWLFIFCLLGIALNLFGYYVTFYILWKSKTISAAWRMLIGIFIGAIFSLFSGGFFSLVAFVINRKRILEYCKRDFRFLKDQLIMCVLLPLICMIIVTMGVLVSLEASISIIILLVVFPFASFIYSLKCIQDLSKADAQNITGGNVLFIVLCLFCLVLIANNIFLPNPDGMLYQRMQYQRDFILMLIVLVTSRIFIISLIVTILIYIVFIPAYSIHIMNREKEAGNTFYNSMFRLNMAGFVLFFCILSLTSFISHHLFSGDQIINDVPNLNDPSLAGADTIVTPTPDITTTHIADIPTGDPSMTMAVDPGIGSVGTNPIDLMHNPDISHADFSAADINLNDSAVPHYSAFDVFPDTLANVFDGTNMVDIPQIQQHPFMIFNDPSMHGNFQICDSSGMPQMTISNGNIVNSEYAVIGHVNTNAAGVTTFSDMNNVPIYSVDSHGQMFSDGCYIGHTIHSGNVVEIRDINENLLAIKDTLTGTCRTPDGKILSQIKQM